MDIWIKAAQLFLSLAILVTLHEFGHFLPARLFKTRIEKFYLFFNPWFSLFRFKKVNGIKKTAWFTKDSPKEWKEDENTTEWGLGWLPLGGYVKIAGMMDESMDKEQLKQPVQDWEFRSKSPWKRLIIMVGGVTVNLILGFLIYICVVFVWGQTQAKPTDLKHGLSVHPYLQKYNLVSGDKVVELDGNPVLSVEELNKEILLRDARKLKILHVDGKVSDVTLPEKIDMELFTNGAFPAFGYRSKTTKVDEVVPKSPAQKAGLQKNDVIRAINGKEIEFFDDLQGALFAAKGKSAGLIVLRGPLKVDEIIPLSNAAKAGLQKNDIILEIKGKEIEFVEDLQGAFSALKDTSAGLTVLRGKSPSDTVRLTIKVDSVGKVDFKASNDTVRLTTQVNSDGTIGFQTVTKERPSAIKTAYYGFFESVAVGFQFGKNTLGDYVSQFKFLFTKKGASSLGGFASIGNMFPPVWDWQLFWLNTALLSIILAFMNILPIPALDGGHVVFLIYEIITGKEAPAKVLEVAQYIGIILLLGLMVYANGNDLIRWLF